MEDSSFLVGIDSQLRRSPEENVRMRLLCLIAVLVGLDGQRMTR